MEGRYNQPRCVFRLDKIKEILSTISGLPIDPLAAGLGKVLTELVNLASELRCLRDELGTHETLLLGLTGGLKKLEADQKGLKKSSVVEYLLYYSNSLCNLSREIGIGSAGEIEREIAEKTERFLKPQSKRSIRKSVGMHRRELSLICVGISERYASIKSLLCKIAVIQIPSVCQVAAKECRKALHHSEHHLGTASFCVSQNEARSIGMILGKFLSGDVPVKNFAGLSRTIGVKLAIIEGYFYRSVGPFTPYPPPSLVYNGCFLINNKSFGTDQIVGILVLLISAATTLCVGIFRGEPGFDTGTLGDVQSRIKLLRKRLILLYWRRVGAQRRGTQKEGLDRHRTSHQQTSQDTLEEDLAYDRIGELGDASNLGGGLGI